MKYGKDPDSQRSLAGTSGCQLNGRVVRAKVTVKLRSLRLWPLWAFSSRNFYSCRAKLPQVDRKSTGQTVPIAEGRGQPAFWDPLILVFLLTMRAGLQIPVMTPNGGCGRRRTGDIGILSGRPTDVPVHSRADFSFTVNLLGPNSLRHHETPHELYRPHITNRASA